MGPCRQQPGIYKRCRLRIALICAAATVATHIVTVAIGIWRGPDTHTQGQGLFYDDRLEEMWMHNGGLLTDDVFSWRLSFFDKNVQSKPRRCPSWYASRRSHTWKHHDFLGRVGHGIPLRFVVFEYVERDGSSFNTKTNERFTTSAIYRKVMMPNVFLPIQASASFAIVFMLYFAIYLGFDGWVRRWRRQRGRCAACGYPVVASSDRCPECGMCYVAGGPVAR